MGLSYKDLAIVVGASFGFIVAGIFGCAAIHDYFIGSNYVGDLIYWLR